MEIKQYRISKYNPKYRIGGVYTNIEWTAFSDVGKLFEGKVLTKREYERVEQNYVKTVLEIFSASKWKNVYVENLELYDSCLRYTNGESLGLNNISSIVKDCLREQCWCQLVNPFGFIHFGYDYYVYVGTNLDYCAVQEICAKYSLFAEIKRSPYI